MNSIGLPRMSNAKSNDIRIIGIGQLGISVASFFYDDLMTTGIDYNRETFTSSKIDNGLLLKNFDFASSERMEGIFQAEKGIVIDNLKSPIVFLVGQTEGKFQETIIPIIIKTLKASGVFIGFFAIVPLGADKKSHIAKMKPIFNFLDVMEIIDSDQLLSSRKLERILDINNIYYNAIKEKISAILKVLNNSNILGISVRDIKMMTEMFGPIYLKILNYSFKNFSVIERDFFEHISSLELSKIKRLYLIFEVSNDIDSTEIISFLKRIKSRIPGIDIRQGFIHSDNDFGLIILHFGNIWLP